MSPEDINLASQIASRGDPLKGTIAQLIAGTDVREAQATQLRASAKGVETPQQRFARESYITSLQKAKTSEEIDHLIAQTDLLNSQGLLTDSEAEKNRELLQAQKSNLQAGTGLKKAETSVATARVGLLNQQTITEEFNRPLAEAKNDAQVDNILANIDRAKKLNQLTDAQVTQMNDLASIKKAKTTAEVDNIRSIISGRSKSMEKTDADIAEIKKFSDAQLDLIEQQAEVQAATAALADEKRRNIVPVETPQQKYDRAIDVANINARASMNAAGRKYQEADLKTIRSQILKMEGVSDFSGLKAGVENRVTDTTTLATSLFASQNITADQAVATARAQMISAYDALDKITSEAGISDLSPIINTGVDTSVVLRKLIDVGMTQDEANRLIDATISSLRNAN